MASMVRSLIEALGGPAEVTRWVNEHGPSRLQKDGDSVQAWMLRNNIPWRWRAAVRAMADEQGLVLKVEWENALSLFSSPEKQSAASERV